MGMRIAMTVCALSRNDTVFGRLAGRTGHFHIYRIKTRRKYLAAGLSDFYFRSSPVTYFLAGVFIRMTPTSRITSISGSI